MHFAVVELKYVKKRTFIVPISWIKNYKINHSLTQEFYCYISTDLKDDPNFEIKYLLKFNGNAGLFKVFVLTVTGTADTAFILLFIRYGQISIFIIRTLIIRVN